MDNMHKKISICLIVCIFLYVVKLGYNIYFISPFYFEEYNGNADLFITIHDYTNNRIIHLTNSDSIKFSNTLIDNIVLHPNPFIYDQTLDTVNENIYNIEIYTGDSHYMFLINSNRSYNYFNNTQNKIRILPSEEILSELNYISTNQKEQIALNETADESAVSFYRSNI